MADNHIIWCYGLCMYVRMCVHTYVLAANGGDRVMYVNIGRCKVGMCGDGRIPQPTRACSTAAAVLALTEQNSQEYVVSFYFLSCACNIIVVYTYNYMCDV